MPPRKSPSTAIVCRRGRDSGLGAREMYHLDMTVWQGSSSLGSSGHRSSLKSGTTLFNLAAAALQSVLVLSGLSTLLAR
jgi:hypothetical protein